MFVSGLIKHRIVRRKSIVDVVDEKASRKEASERSQRILKTNVSDKSFP